MFVAGASGVKEGAERAMQLLLATNHAEAQSDAELRERAFRDALALADRLKEDPQAIPVIDLQLGNILGNLAGVVLHRRNHSYEKNRDEALVLYEQAIAHFRRMGDSEGVWKTHYNIAAGLSVGLRADDLVDIELGLSHLRKALVVLREEGRAPPFQVVLNFGSLAGRSSGERRQDHLREALPQVEPLTSLEWRQQAPEVWASAQNTLGALLTSLRGPGALAAWKAGLAAFEKALEIRTHAARPLEWAQTTVNIINVRAELEAVDEAGAVGDPRRDVRDLKAAMRELERAGRQTLAATAARSVGRRLFKFARHAPPQEVDGLLQEARETLKSALRWFSPEAAPGEFVETGVTLFDVLVALKDDAAARELGSMLLRVSQILEEGGVQLERVQLLSALLQRVASSTAMLYLVGQEPGLAIEALEIARARYLQASLRLTGAPELDKAVLGLRREMRDLERQIKTADTADHERLERFAKLRSAFLTAITQTPCGAADPMELIRSAAPHFAALAWILVSEIGAALIVLTPNDEGPAVRVAALNADKLRGPGSVFHSWSQAYAAAHRGEASNIDVDPENWGDQVERIAARLWEDVAGPLADLLAASGVPRGSPVAVLPPGALAVLPLAVARDPQSTEALLDRYAVSIAPSLATLVGEGSKDPPRLAAVVNPAGDLPFTAIEATEAGRRFPPDACVMLKGDECTAEAVAAALAGSTYWMFSSHGEFNPAEPRESSLLLAHDARLTLASLLASTRGAAPRMVILSACESGIQETDTMPDEFIGFPTAFLQLGSMGVLATLWPVNDASAALITARFLELHVGQGLPPSEALRQAQLWLRGVPSEEIQDYLADLAAGTTGAAKAALLAVAEALRVAGPSERPFQDPEHWGAFSLFGR